jgi:hypothetical protein
MIHLHSQRVVLDLTFTGYGLSAELVARDGELLGIASPGKVFDPVIGACVVHKHLGTAVDRLLDVGARFDCIVAEVGEGFTPAVGVFTPPLRLGLPRRLLETMPTPQEQISYGEAIWRAAHLLLSGIGVAILNGTVLGPERRESYTTEQARLFRKALL